MNIRVGTRGSTLARTQTQGVVYALQALLAGTTCSLHIVHSLADDAPDVPIDRLGSDGVFTRALEQALVAGSIDTAVHSAKDLPSTLPEGFVLAAVTRREDARDCLVTRDGLGLDQLPAGATVGTGSPRRTAQIHLARPDLRFVPLRGNVDTRRSAALSGNVDAAVLAMAGVARLGLVDRHVVPLEPEVCLPQAGQGALALEILAGARHLNQMLAAMDDVETRACVDAERAVLAGLAAGCQAPIAAYATCRDGVLRLRAFVSNPAGSPIRADRTAPMQAALRLGRETGTELLDQRAGDVLDAARRIT